MTHAKTPRPGETGPEAAGGYLRERELAERWKVSGRMLGRWRQNGDGPPFIRVGRRRILYRLADCGQCPSSWWNLRCSLRRPRLRRPWMG